VKEEGGKTREVTPTGSEHPRDFLGKTASCAPGGAPGGAVGAPVNPAELIRLVASCDQLPEHLRAAVVALIQTAAP
jgi:hypothetical protein